MRKTEMFSTRDKFKKENITKPLDQTNSTKIYCHLKTLYFYKRACINTEF